MKGVVLAGGEGMRLRPMTSVVNKHLLPLYDRPVLCYPIETLLRSGIDEILIVTTPSAVEECIDIVDSVFGNSDAEFEFRAQDSPDGIADALLVAEDFIDTGEAFAVILGDNILLTDFTETFESFTTQNTYDAMIFLKRVSNPSQYGVAEITDGSVSRLVEKPDTPQSDTAVIGLYVYTDTVFDVIQGIEPSVRGEYEITDVNKTFLEENTLTHALVESEWYDVGTPERLLDASTHIKEQTQPR